LGVATADLPSAGFAGPALGCVALGLLLRPEAIP
jgi:hypothetical protein